MNETQTIEVAPEDAALVESMLADARARRQADAERVAPSRRDAPALPVEDRPAWAAYCRTKGWSPTHAYDAREQIDFALAREQLEHELAETDRAAAEARQLEERTAEDDALGAAHWRAEAEQLEAELVDHETEVSRLTSALSVANADLRKAQRGLESARAVAARLGDRDAAAQAERRRQRAERDLVAPAWQVAQASGVSVPEAECVLRQLNGDADRATAWCKRQVASRGPMTPVDAVFDM